MFVDKVGLLLICTSTTPFRKEIGLFNLGILGQYSKTLRGSAAFCGDQGKRALIEWRFSGGIGRRFGVLDVFSAIPASQRLSGQTTLYALRFTVMEAFLVCDSGMRISFLGVRCNLIPTLHARS